MSSYRQSPSKSPYKSIARSIIDDRYLIEDELHLKRGIALEADNRRLADETSILRLKLRRAEEQDIKYEALIQQIALLTQTNDQLMLDLNDRRIEVDRLRVAQVQNQERELYKNAQLSDHSKNLEIENSELQRERLESTKVYEGHIRKLEILLEENIKDRERLAVGLDKLANEKETAEIRFEEERARLKNEMTRTEYQREREAEQDKERRYAEKLMEIENMKRNHFSQIQLLEDEVTKLSRLSELKSNELETQILQNRQLKVAQEAEKRELEEQNQTLRMRMARLEEHNRSEIENIEAKYSNIQVEGTISLKEQHGNEVRLLLSEHDKLKWLLGEKNLEIQQLTQEKRDLRQYSEDQQLQLNSEINLLKSKLVSQQDKYTEDKHNQTAKINSLEEKFLRDSESYHERVRHFTGKIEEFQGDTRKKEVAYDKLRKEAEMDREKLLREKENLRQELSTFKLSHTDNTDELKREKERAEDYRKKSQVEYQKLAREIAHHQQANDTLKDQLLASQNDSEHQLSSRAQENESLKRMIAKLEKHLEELQSKSTTELGDLSGAHRAEVKRIEDILALKLQEASQSFREQLSSVENQLRVAKKYASDKEEELRNLLARFEELNVHFDNRERLVQFVPKSDSSILEAFNQQRQESEFRVFEA